uniref:Uncharacterized protein n=1 Tax=Fagus sylvatica TaxID=28930 RepID=A0A2N9HGL1_FAGSY
MGRLTSGETCVRGIGETPKVQGHVRSSLVGGGGDHAETICGGGVGDENGSGVCMGFCGFLVECGVVFCVRLKIGVGEADGLGVVVGFCGGDEVSWWMGICVKSGGFCEEDGLVWWA